jgi:DNA invertase Pin-like site-specific DNA recombinase
MYIMRAVAYYRVSTDKQGKSGLGLDAQRATVRAFLKSDYPPLKEFQENESGKRRDRPELLKALRYAKVHKAALVVAKLDRLTRNADFLRTIRESGVRIIFCDLPETQGATGEAIIGFMGVIAQLEAGLISERTKAALKIARERGTVLGGYRGYTPDPALGAAAARKKADEKAAEYAETFSELRSEGAKTAYALAKALNERGIPSPRGGKWQSVTVERVQSRL